MSNPLRLLEEQGQSVWLDYIRRDMIHSGELKTLIEDDGLKGVTSNPAIFEQAIAGSDLYDERIQSLANLNPVDVYESLAVEDIQGACDLMSPVYEATQGHDGFVSLEVSPHLAHDTDGTVAEARRLNARVNRRNVMIKVPATPAGLPAITALIAEGINVNVTLIFSQSAYRDVAVAFCTGLQQRKAQGNSLDWVSSVASVFVSRIDSLVDLRLNEIASSSPDMARLAKALQGRCGIANLKLIYQIYLELFYDNTFNALTEAGAQRQRPLWASTSTKNAAYPDVLYVENLIGPDTVNTLPPETLSAFRDHGRVGPTIDQGLEEAECVIKDIVELGVDLDGVMAQLIEQGVTKFVEPFDRLIESVRQKRSSIAA